MPIPTGGARFLPSTGDLGLRRSKQVDNIHNIHWPVQHSVVRNVNVYVGDLEMPHVAHALCE